MMSADDNKELRERIRAIQLDTNLSPEEKRKSIQQLTTRSFTKNKELVPNRSKVCEHYEKKCSQFYFNCCKTWDPCRRCHKERNTCEALGSSIKSIVCSECDTVQAPSGNCTSCKIQFAASHCGLCNVWTHIENITHCYSCGFCRIGKAEEIEHCDDCEVCYLKCKAGGHQCLKVSYRHSTCAVCRESMFDTTKRPATLHCKHVIHIDCLEGLIMNCIFRCPTCKKSLANMSNIWRNRRKEIKANPLGYHIFPFHCSDIVVSPYGNFKIESMYKTLDGETMCSGYFTDWSLTDNSFPRGILHRSSLRIDMNRAIYCNDCENKSTTQYHFAGLECGHCKGFNTQV